MSSQAASYPYVLKVHSRESIISHLLPLLHHYLPYTIIVYRRLQYQLSDPTGKHAQAISVFPADSPPETVLAEVRGAIRTPQPEDSDLQSQNGAEIASRVEPTGWKPSLQGGDRSPWMIVYADASRLTETTVFTFSSVELPILHSPAPNQTEANNGIFDQQSKLQLKQLLIHIRDGMIPIRPTTPPQGWPFGKQIETRAYKRSNVLLGALHENVLDLLNDLHEEAGGDLSIEGSSSFPSLSSTAGSQGSTALNLRILRTDFPYLKLLFPQESYHGQSPPLVAANSDCELPLGLHFAPLTRTAEYELVLDRTHIPRTVQTLSVFPSIGVFPNAPVASIKDAGEKQEPSSGMPIAWGFLGYDSALSSLHVEPAYRGQGIAETIARYLWRNIMEERFCSTSISASISLLSSEKGRDEDSDGGIRTEEGGWAHADVHEHNRASKRVMEKLGAIGPSKRNHDTATYAVADDERGDNGRVRGWRVAWTEVDLGEPLNN